MSDEGRHDVTQLLLAWGQGDEQAMAQLTTLVYDEVHRTARRYMAHERPGHTLQATALVNEAYLKLVDSSRTRWQNRAHFFAVAAQLMRRILVDFARSRGYQKRGGNLNRGTMDHALGLAPEPDADVQALDEALTELARMDTRKAKVGRRRQAGFRPGGSISQPFFRAH